MKGIGFGKGIAASILAMGIIHDVMTFSPFILDAVSSLSKESADVYVCFSLGTGTSLILCGLLLLMLLWRIERYPFVAAPVMLIGVFLFIFGLLMLWFMPLNPFAWVVAALCFTMFSLAVWYRRQEK